MSSNDSLLIFKSLNCYVCETPFCEMRTNGGLSSVQMKCGVAICVNCSKDRGTHACTFGPTCTQLFEGSRFYLHLFYNGLLTKTPSGYTMYKMFSAPGCCHCTKSFELQTRKKHPFILKCGHSICLKCLRNLRSEPNMGRNYYELACPTCKKLSIMSSESQENQIKLFLRELPVIQKQFKSNQRWSFLKFARKDNHESDNVEKNVGKYDYGKVPTYLGTTSSSFELKRKKWRSFDALFERLYD